MTPTKSGVPAFPPQPVPVFRLPRRMTPTKSGVPAFPPQPVPFFRLPRQAPGVRAGVPAFPPQPVPFFRLPRPPSTSKRCTRLRSAATCAIFQVAAGRRRRRLFRSEDPPQPVPFFRLPRAGNRLPTRQYLFLRRNLGHFAGCRGPPPATGGHSRRVFRRNLGHFAGCRGPPEFDPLPALLPRRNLGHFAGCRGATPTPC